MKIRERKIFFGSLISYFTFEKKFSEGDKVELIMSYSTMTTKRKVDQPSFSLDTQSEIQILNEKSNNGCV